MYLLCFVGVIGLKPFSCNLCGAKFRTSGLKKAHLKKHLKETEKELKKVQNIGRKSNDIEGHFLESIFKEEEYLSQIKTSPDNETVPVSCIEGSQYLVPLNAENMVAEEDKTSLSDMSDYLINIDESGTGTVESPRYLYSVKDSCNGGEGFIVEKITDQIIVTITDGNSTILSSSNHSIPNSSISSQVIN